MLRKCYPGDLRDKLARNRVIIKHEERKTRCLRFGHKDYYSEVQKKLVSKLFLSLRTEENKRGLQKNHLAKIPKISFREMIKLASNSFQNVTCVTYERYKIILKSNEIVRDLFISKQKNMTLQDSLTFETLAPDKVLIRAIKFEHSKLTKMALQTTNAAGTAGTSTSYNSGFKIKPELIMAVRSSNGRNRKLPFKRDSNRKENRKRLTISNIQTKPCNRCGRTFDAVQLKSCLAIGKTCKNCNKLYHFSKLCRSQQWRKVA